MSDDATPREQCHVPHEQLGGSGELVQIRPRTKLHDYELRLELVDDPLEHVDVVITANVPKRRRDCPLTRPCGAVKCTWNLSRVDGADRAGRRHHEGHVPPTTLRFVADATTNCALDLSHRPTLCKRIAKEMGMDIRRVQQIVRGAVLKLKAAGVDVREFMALLAEEGHENPEPTISGIGARPVAARKTQAR